MPVAFRTSEGAQAMLIVTSRARQLVHGDKALDRRPQPLDGQVRGKRISQPLVCGNHAGSQVQGQSNIEAVINSPVKSCGDGERLFEEGS